MQRRAFLGYVAAGLGALGLALFAGWWQVDGPGAPEPVALRPRALSSMGFRLIDHDGQPVGPETLIGRTSLVFFGFTYCPDVCPTTLADISDWLEAMGEDAERLNVAFITVDPARDTVETMAKYVGFFHPAIRGWTGPENQVARAAEAFRITYKKVPVEGSDYTMDHTASVFVFDAGGRFASTIDYHEPREIAVPKIRGAMKKRTDKAT